MDTPNPTAQSDTQPFNVVKSVSKQTHGKHAGARTHPVEAFAHHVCAAAAAAAAVLLLLLLSLQVTCPPTAGGWLPSAGERDGEWALP
jgi:hypothetical protein